MYVFFFVFKVGSTIGMPCVDHDAINSCDVLGLEDHDAPRNKGLIRPYYGNPIVNKPLIRPYFWGCTLGS